MAIKICKRRLFRRFQQTSYSSHFRKVKLYSNISAFSSLHLSYLVRH